MLNFSNESNLILSRSQFLNSLVSSNKKLVGDNLIKKIKINKLLYSLLQNACYNYIISCLLANKMSIIEAKSYEDFLLLNEKNITSMVNVTPNGVIKPKYETISEFNQIHKSLNLILSDNEIDKNVAKIRAPISIRIVSSSDDPDILLRPRANNKMHSDFWTGSVCDFAILIPIFGTIETIDVVFCEPHGITEDYLKEYPNYNDGQNTYSGYTEYKTKMEKGSLFLQDIFCLHGTRRTGKGVRISIDFTLQSNQYDKTIKTYYSKVASSKDKHLSTIDWMKLGYENIYYENETMLDAERNKDYKNNYNEALLGSAIRLQTSGKASIVSLNKIKEILKL